MVSLLAQITTLQLTQKKTPTTIFGGEQCLLGKDKEQSEMGMLVGLAFKLLVMELRLSKGTKELEHAITQQVKGSITGPTSSLTMELSKQEAALSSHLMIIKDGIPLSHFLTSRVNQANTNLHQGMEVDQCFCLLLMVCCSQRTIIRMES